MVNASQPALAQSAATVTAPVVVEMLAAVEARDTTTLRQVVATGRPAPSEMAAALLQAAATGHREGVALLLQSGADPRRTERGGWTPLLVALLNGHADIARDLQAAGADPAARTADGVSAADLAAALGDEALAASLRPPPAPPQRLFAAAAAGDVAAIRAAIAAGAAIDARDGAGWTPLMHAALRGRREAAAALLDARADPKVVAPDGNSPLAAAVLGGDGAIAGRILDAGAPVDAVPRGGRRPLVLAIALRDEPMARMLLARGANPQAAAGEEAPAAYLAAAAGLTELAQRLSPTVRRPPPPGALAEAIAAGNLALVTELGRRVPDINSPLPNGLTPIHFALAAKQFQVVETLANQFRPHVRGRNTLPGGDGGNIFHTAARVGAEPWVLSAIASQVNRERGLWDELAVGVDDRGRTPLLVSLMGDGQVAHWLYNMGADDRVLRQADRDGITPLLAATLRGNATAVRGLVAKGVPLETGRGRPSLHDIARSRQDWAVLAALPDDRRPPEGLVKGASRDVRREFQRLLTTWGYYRGPLDGAFGPTSTAAIRAFLLDRQREVVAMAEADGSPSGWRRWQPTNGAISTGPQASWGAFRAQWFHYRWHNGDEFTGYSERGGQIRNGIGLFRWSNGQEQVFLLAPTGQRRDDEVLQ